MAPPAWSGLVRPLVLGTIFGAEVLILSVWLDNAALASRSEFLPGLLASWGAWSLRAVLAFVALFLTFAFLKDRLLVTSLACEAQRAPIRGGLLGLHAAAMSIFAVLAWALYGNHLGSVSANLATALWLLLGIAGIASAACALIPASIWSRLIRETGLLWLYASIAVAVACVIGAYGRQVWNPAAQVTFGLVKLLLRPFAPVIVADTVRMSLGTPRFHVEIAPECSGFEGIGLILTFGMVWLWLFRRECRFPQALLLLPAGAVTIYLLNAVRIAALILIGDAGAPQIALGGFHSQAGWISFNVVALALSVSARRLRWFSTNSAPEPATEGIVRDNPTAAYLLPFLSVLAVGTLTAAVSGGFEWLYPLRFFVAAGVLWSLRKSYVGLDWRPGWFGPVMGAAMFGVWIGLDAVLNRRSGGASGDAMPMALAASSVGLRAGWIAIRILAATLTVPIAEELAFRGFLIRRFISPAFETIPVSSFTWLGLVASSVFFGLLHGGMWLAGIVAGFGYAWALIRRGKIGDAAAAHATTNALLAVYVLTFQQWHLW